MPGQPITGTRSRNDRRPAERTPPWTTWLPLGFVILALLALLLFPTIMHRRALRLRSDIFMTAEPARRATSELQLWLAREMSAVRGLLLTGEREYLERYTRADQAGHQALERLDSLAQRMDPQTAAQVARLASLDSLWQERVAPVRVPGEPPARQTFIARLSADQRIFDQLLLLSERVEESIIRWEARRTRQIEAYDQVRLRATAVLVLLALGAATVVGWIGQRLRHLIVDLARATRLRDEVLGIVSHDLRSPLNTIMLSSELLLGLEPEGAETGDLERRQLGVIKRSVEQMNRLIQDLLDVARMEAGRLPMACQPLRVGPLLSEVVELHRAQIEAKSLRLESALPAELPPVLADRERVLQVFSNLIGNAAKFTPAGGRIFLRAERHGREVRFSVTDTGPGIAPEQIEHIFDPFWQAQRGAREGAGLGLPIAKGIVDAHGGRVWVESEEGVGSTFYFTLPTATRQTRG